MAEKSGELNNDTLKANENINDVANSNEKIKSAYLVDSKDDEVKTANEIPDDPDAIRANIEETRAEMGETIDAIQERLSFENISEQVKEEVSEYISETFETAKNTVYETTIKKVGEIMKYVDKGLNQVADTQVVRTARRNPLALTLIGLGIGMLLVGGKQKKKVRYNYNDTDSDTEGYGYRYSSSDNKSMTKTARDKMSDAAGAVSDSVSNAAGAVSDKVGNVAGTVSDTVSNVAGTVSGTVSDVAGKAYDKIGNLGSYATDIAGNAQDKYEYYMEENPLAVGAVALALGAAVGLSIPSTRVENRWMGEARENLLQKAEETAREAVGKVQQVAGQVTETVKEEAKNQGLT